MVLGRAGPTGSTVRLCGRFDCAATSSEEVMYLPVESEEATCREPNWAVAAGTNCPGGGGNLGTGMLWIRCPECVYVCASFLSWSAASRRRRSWAATAVDSCFWAWISAFAPAPGSFMAALRSSRAFCSRVSSDPSFFGTAAFAWAIAVATCSRTNAAPSLYFPSSSVAMEASCPQSLKAWPPSPSHTTRVMWAFMPSPTLVIVDAAADNFFAS